MRQALWTVGLAAVVLVVIHHLLYEESAIVLRGILVLVTLGVAFVFLVLQNDWRWSDILGTDPDPIAIGISGAVGIPTWLIAWWLMALFQEDILPASLDTYTPPAIYQYSNWDSIWTPLVLTDIVLVPLFLAALVWGILRLQVQSWPILPANLLLGGVFGLLGMVIFGQGIVGLLGYGLCGLVAGFLSLQTRSAWTGFAVHATFMYATLDFWDNLLDEMLYQADNGMLEAEPYLGIKWLSFVLVAALLVVVFVQIVRFRGSSEDEHTPLHFGAGEWVAFLPSLAALIFVIVDELGRRGGL